MYVHELCVHRLIHRSTYLPRVSHHPSCRYVAVTNYVSKIELGFLRGVCQKNVVRIT